MYATMYLTWDYYDRDKVVGLGQFRHIFSEPHFRRSSINPPSQLLGFQYKGVWVPIQRGMGPDILIVVVYSPEKTIGYLIHVNCFSKTAI